MKSGAWDSAAQWWNDWIESGRDVYRANLLGPELLKACGDVAGLRVLDVGCGEGWFSRILASHGANVTAFDVAGTLVDMAQEKEARESLGINYLTLDAEQIGQNWTAQEFDLVTASMAMECVPDVQLAMDGIANVLKTNGRLAMTTAHPNFEIIRTDSDKSMTPSRKWVPSGLNQRRRDPSAPPIMVWQMPVSDWKQLVANSGLAFESLNEPLLDESMEPDNSGPHSGTRTPPFMVLTATK